MKEKEDDNRRLQKIEEEEDLRFSPSFPLSHSGIIGASAPLIEAEEDGKKRKDRR